MQIAAALLAVLTLSSTADANTDTYVATSSVASVHQYTQLGVSLEGGTRLGASQMFARGQLGSGVSGEATAHGTYRLARAGLEARECISSEWLCGFTGLDLGYGRERLMVPYSDRGIVHVHGMSAVPRVGFDGGNSLRVRVALELPIYDRLGSASSTRVGGGASFGFGYTF